MIYLIGGAPRIGKSTISKRLVESTTGKLISTDTLEDPNQDSPIFYDEANKNTLSPAARIKAVVNEAEAIISKIEKIIENAINRHEDMIIEGVHLLPIYVNQWLQRYGTNNISVIYLGSINKDLVVEGMIKSTSPNNWSGHYNRDVLNQIAIFVCAYSEYLRSECNKYNFLYRERTGDFTSDTNAIIQRLSNHEF